MLRTWLAERGGQPEQPLFPNRSGGGLSRDAIEHRLAKHTATAAASCTSLNGKAVTAHTLRHTAAMRLLQSGTDTSVIALWLGREQAETTKIYLHADLALKERALARTTPGLDATSRRTSSSHSSKPSDYANLSAAHAAATSGDTSLVGIIRRSA